MMNTPVTIGLIQEAVTSDIAANVERAVERVRETAGRGAQIICLQELFNAPYFCKAQKAERFDIAEPIPGPAVERMQKLAQELDVVIIVPVFERQAAGVYRNSAAIVDAGGQMLGVYRKMHIPDDPLFYEKYYFVPGDSNVSYEGDHRGVNGFRVWKTKFAKIGVLICWDQWYPEAARITSLLGAEILFYPTAIGWHPAEKSTFGQAQLEAWQTAQRAHAIANGVFVAAPNRVGKEEEEGTDGIEFFGHSFICDPFGRKLAEAGTDPAVIVAECDRNLIEDTRRNWPFLRDRRIDAYGPILNRYLG
jgi:N-carbamoylputrescine amidase